MKTGIKNTIILLGFIGAFVGSTASAFAGYFNTTPVNRCDSSITRNLSLGSENNEVLILQAFLSSTGYLNATPNGHFGYATRSAVKNFQADNDISATGQVGEATRNAINERLCDGDTGSNSVSYNNYGGYGYSTGVTYVDSYDKYAKVINPPVTAPVVYTNPTNSQAGSYSNGIVSSYGASVSNYTNYPQTNFNSTPVINSVLPINSPIQNGVQGTGIIYSPYLGYSYGITPSTGSVTVSTPVANTVYNEGDTVFVAFGVNNINATVFNILLENTTSGQSKIATVVSNGNYNTSFVLTKPLLDAVCAGVCDNNNQGSFRIVVTTPLTDIAGNTAPFRAMISPITIKRPYSNFGTVSITGSKSPVNSNEVFKLYVNIPTGSSWNTNAYGNYSFKIHALCPTGVAVSIAGTPCGQDFVIPFAPTYFQQEIPAAITNNTWYKQDVTFEIIVTNLAGQTIGQSTTVITANGAPFSW